MSHTHGDGREVTLSCLAIGQSVVICLLTQRCLGSLGWGLEPDHTGRPAVLTPSAAPREQPLPTVGGRNSPEWVEQNCLVPSLGPWKSAAPRCLWEPSRGEDD